MPQLLVESGEWRVLMLHNRFRFMDFVDFVDFVDILYEILANIPADVE